MPDLDVAIVFEIPRDHPKDEIAVSCDDVAFQNIRQLRDGLGEMFDRFIV